jgi:hypothetical protein
MVPFAACRSAPRAPPVLPANRRRNSPCPLVRTRSHRCSRTRPLHLRPPAARRLRPAPVRRGRTGTPTASSAPTSARSTASRASSSRSGRRARTASAWSATSTTGTGASTRCGCAAAAASGSCSSRASSPAAVQVRGARQRRQRAWSRSTPTPTPSRSARRTPASCSRAEHLPLAATRTGSSAAPSATGSTAHVHLRGAPGLLAARRGRQLLNYRELAEQLADYCTELGFTHVELLPITEHPLDASWGYQATGYFAPTARFGTPDDFRWFVDHCTSTASACCWTGCRRTFPRDTVGAWPLRRHGALRARRPAPGRAQGLGHADLQLRPPRGEELPALQRAVLAQRVPHRRPARGRGRLDALPGLLPRGRRVDTRTSTAATRTWTRSTSCASSTPSPTSSTPAR